MNAYETARERMERANQMCREVKAGIDALERLQLTIEAEWAAAMRDVRQYEIAPGIPLPQYREQVSE